MHLIQSMLVETVNSFQIEADAKAVSNILLIEKNVFLALALQFIILIHVFSVDLEQPHSETLF